MAEEDSYNGTTVIVIRDYFQPADRLVEEGVPDAAAFGLIDGGYLGLLDGELLRWIDQGEVL